jgi:hypothetical protein
MSTIAVAPKIKQGPQMKDFEITYLIGVLQGRPPHRNIEWNSHVYPTSGNDPEKVIVEFKKTMDKYCFGIAKIIVLSIHEVDTDT